MKAGSGYRRIVVLGIGLAILTVVGALVGRHYVGRHYAAAATGPGALASAKTQPPAGGAQDKSKDKKDGEVKGNAKGKEPEKAPVPVSVSPIEVGPVSSYITSTANLVPESEVKVLAEAEGRVAELLVEEGSRVGRNQVLAELAKDDAEIAFKKGQLKASSTKIAFDRAAKMVADSLMSQEMYDKVATDNAIAQQELAEAQWRLDKTTIKAPFKGRITDRNVKLGQHVRPGDVLFTVSDFEPLIAKIYLPEKDVLGLKEGREVRITLKADGKTRFGGRIRQISPVVDTSTGTVKVTVEATAPPSEVRPGAFVSIDIVHETRTAATLLPRESVIRELQESYVFVANGSVAQKRSVTLGIEEGTRIEALSGVKPGERVITAGQGGLKEGTSIKIIPTSEAHSELGADSDAAQRG